MPAPWSQHRHRAADLDRVWIRWTLNRYGSETSNSTRELSRRDATYLKPPDNQVGSMMKLNLTSVIGYIAESTWDGMGLLAKNLQRTAKKKRLRKLGVQGPPPLQKYDEIRGRNTSQEHTAHLWTALQGCVCMACIVLGDQGGCGGLHGEVCESGHLY